MDCFVKMEDQDVYFINHQEDHFLTDIFADQKPQIYNQFQREEDKKFCLPTFKTNFQQNCYLSKEEKILEELCNSIELKSCSLSQIKNYLSKFYWEQNYNSKALMKMIIKAKLKVKRQQAKKRTQLKKRRQMQNKEEKNHCNGSNSNLIDLTQYESGEFKNETRIDEDCKRQDEFCHYIFCNQQEDQVQKKKKRNRVSAQISRDKRKQYIKSLQRDIEQLKSINSANQNIIREKQCLSIIVSQQNQRISQLYQCVDANEQINRKLIQQNLKLKQEMQKLLFLLEQQNQTQIDMKVNLFAFQKLKN